VQSYRSCTPPQVNLQLLLNRLSSADQAEFMRNRFPYFYYRSVLFLELGPEQYALQDALQLPESDLSNQELDDYRKGCTQILEGFGFSRQRPFVGLGRRGLTSLVTLFHYNKASSLQYPVEDSMSNDFVQEVTCVHEWDEHEVKLYNRISGK
jgi:hypothetical protein